MRIVERSHAPVLPSETAYSVMLMRMVPTDMSQAGQNRLSVGCVRDALNVEGYNRNRHEIIVTLNRNSTMLRMKKMHPMV